MDCNEDDKGAKSCALYIAFINNKSKAVVLGWTIASDEKSEKGKLVVRTLTGVTVSDGISVQFDGSKPVNIPYKICMPQYCAAEVPFSDAWLKTMTGAKKFSVTYIAANGKEVKQEVDLARFAEAFQYYTAELKS
ncbi:MAG: invasion associated locus B family protein [Rhizobiales bacterium]|nr:invasion associated locus B family protein [Hyphomicrobiales bacterium]